MAEDDNGQRWELTVRGLKRQRWLQFLGGVAVASAAGEDRRQGGWGGLGLAREGEGEKKGVATGGARFKQHAEVGNGSAGWRNASEVEEGTRRDGQPVRGLRPVGAGGGGVGAPLGCVPTRTGENGG
jgi:hypothetical protein